MVVCGGKNNIHKLHTQIYTATHTPMLNVTKLLLLLQDLFAAKQIFQQADEHCISLTKL